jgi:hypothetical protein
MRPGQGELRPCSALVSLEICMISESFYGMVYFNNEVVTER